MDFTFTPEQEKFRQEFSQWLNKALPTDWDSDNQSVPETDEALKKAYQSFQKKLYDAGYAAMHYPKEYGGGGKTINEELIVLQTISDTCYSLKMAGTGFAWENEMHLFLKRAKANDAAFGNPVYHRKQVVRLLTASC